HVLVGGLGIGAVGPGEWDAVAADNRDRTSLIVHVVSNGLGTRGGHRCHPKLQLPVGREHAWLPHDRTHRRCATVIRFSPEPALAGSAPTSSDCHTPRPWSAITRATDSSRVRC